MTEKAQQGFVDRWKAVLLRVAAIPFVFFGVGFYRAWLATFFRYDAFPTISVFDYFLFEGAIGIVSLALAFAARRVTPLWACWPRARAWWADRPSSCWQASRCRPLR